MTTSVTLGADLVCTGTALYLDASVTVDFNGHTITGDIDVRDPQSAYRLESGTLKGNVVQVQFGRNVPPAGVVSGITLDGGITQTGSVTVSGGSVSGDIAGSQIGGGPVLNVGLHNVKVGGQVKAGGTVDVTGSTTGAISDFNSAITVKKSSVAGISAALTSLSIASSAVGSGGIYLSKPYATSLSNDTITGADVGLAYVNGSTGSSGRGPSVTNTHFVGNGTGLQITYPLNLTGTIITGDTFTGNTSSGLDVEYNGSPSGVSAAGSTIASNKFLHNGGDGMHIGAPVLAHGVTVSGNTAKGNGGYGIYAPGVVDGGGNIAARNTGPAQCRGVVCRP